MTLNGQNVTLAEINKIFGAHHKNFNEDKRILSYAKYRPMIVVSIGYADIYRLVTKLPK